MTSLAKLFVFRKCVLCHVPQYFPYRVYQEVRTKVAVSVVTPRYHLPPELTTMINTLVYLESQVR